MRSSESVFSKIFEITGFIADVLSILSSINTFWLKIIPPDSVNVFSFQMEIRTYALIVGIITFYGLTALSFHWWREMGRMGATFSAALIGWGVRQFLSSIPITVLFFLALHVLLPDWPGWALGWWVTLSMFHLGGMIIAGGPSFLLYLVP